MINKWQDKFLEDIGTLARGKSKHRPRWAPELYGGQYPFVQTGQIKEANKYITSFEQTYSEEGLKQSKLWEEGTLCITIAANIAEIAILSFPACFPDSILGFRVYENKADLNFIYYMLLHYQNRLQNMAIGSVQDNINLGTFQKIKFLIPPLPTQRRIAAILSTLDDKIENNRRICEKLEEMAQAIFKQWFVDFNFPDENGEPYKDNGGEMVESELGLIPKGWEIGVISKCCLKIQNGGTPKRKIEEYWDSNDIPWLTSGEVRQNIIDQTNSYISSEGYDNSSAKWLPKYSTVVALYGATAGQVALIATELTTNQAICGLVPKKYYTYFNYITLNLATDRLFNSAIGSAQQNISKKIVESLKITIPNIGVITLFDEAISPIYGKLVNCVFENEKLKQTRNALLPKLMSGEIDVEEVQ